MIEAGADAAVARGMPATAAELFERAATLTEDADARAARAIAAAEHALAAGDARRAESVLRALLDDDATTGSRRAQALATLGEIVYVRAPAEGLALLRSAVEHVGDDRVLEAMIHAYIVGNADPDLKHAIRSADRAVELLDGLDVEPRPNQLAAALLDRAFQWLLLGERAATDDIDRGLALLDLSDNSFLARRAEESGERCLWLIGRLEEAMALDEEQYRWFSERGQLGLLPQLLQAMAMMRLHTGRTDLAERYTREIEDLVESGEEMWRERGVMARAWITAYAGELDEARALASDALARQEEEGDLWEAVIYRSVLGFIELSVPDPSAAFAHLSKAVEQNDEMGVGLPNVGAFLRDYVEAASLVGRRELAEEGTRRFEASVDRLGLPWEVLMLARCRGLLASASGDVAAAIPFFDEALDLLDSRLPLPMDRGRVLLLRGEALRRLGRRREARASLDAASWAFEALGAKAWLVRVESELARLGGRAPAPNALTAAERAVAELAANGLSNREIAARLVVSVRTVENQLSSAYGKLGIGSRRELAGAMPRLPDLSNSTDAVLDGAT
jgi:DNA-binding CsgD family transcriptional regulator